MRAPSEYILYSFSFAQTYHVRERETTIYASSSNEQVSHSNGAGDLNTGRAWRAVRRPSDMVWKFKDNSHNLAHSLLPQNEYAKQIREYRAQEKGKAYGKVFVKGRWQLCFLNYLNLIRLLNSPGCPWHESSCASATYSRYMHAKQWYSLRHHSRMPVVGELSY